jgi:hypothetical protein
MVQSRHGARVVDVYGKVLQRAKGILSARVNKSDVHDAEGPAQLDSSKNRANLA